MEVRNKNLGTDALQTMDAAKKPERWGLGIGGTLEQSCSRGECQLFIVDLPGHADPGSV